MWYAWLLILLMSGGPEPRYALPERQVPVLCYHQVRDCTDADSRQARAYIVPPAAFYEQIKALRDSGYHTILPDRMIAGHAGMENEKAVVITFDDGTASQFYNAFPVLESAGFKAAFFIMTVTLDKPGYMSSAQIKTLSDKGNLIGCHTWDHHKVTAYTAEDWDTQLIRPGNTLKTITGKEVVYFAYPFGVWDKRAVEHLKSAGYKGAFQLAGRPEPTVAAYTIKRIVVDGHWTGKQLIRHMHEDF